MATLNLWFRAEADLTTNVFGMGSLSAPVQLTVTAVHVQKVSLATATTAKLFDVTEDLSDFDYAIILSDQSIFIEQVCDDGNEVGERVFAQKIRANFPFLITHNAAKANYTVNFAAGSDDVIETVRARNESGSTANITSAFFNQEP